MPNSIDTKRLTLIPAGPELLHLELTGAAAVGAALHVAVPKDWPPGEYDRNALEFFLAQHAAGGANAEGWYAWYAVDRASQTLVAAGGYFGPPDAQGKVEIGFSVSSAWRRKGIATDLVSALTENARARGAWRIIAHTAKENSGALGALAANGFHPCAPEREGLLGFEHTSAA